MVLIAILSINDTQHNDIQNNDAQHNEIQNNNTQHNDIQALVTTGLIATLGINDTQHKDTKPLMYSFAALRINEIFIVMLGVGILWLCWASHFLLFTECWSFFIIC